MTSVLNKNTPEVVLRSYFSVYDVDKNGKLSKTEFGCFLNKLGLDSDELEQRALQALADESNDGDIDFEEFCNWIKNDDIQSIVNDSSQFEFLCMVTELFDAYDADGDGQISWEEWRQFFIDSERTEDDAKAMWFETNTNGDSKITLNEFWLSLNGSSVDEDNNEQKSNNNNGTDENVKNQKYMFVMIQFNAQFEASDVKTETWTKCKYGSVSKSIEEKVVIDALVNVCGKKPKKRMEGEFVVNGEKFLYVCDRKPFAYMFTVRGDTNFDEVKQLLNDLENIHRTSLTGVKSVASVNFQAHFKQLTEYIDNKTISWI